MSNTENQRTDTPVPKSTHADWRRMVMPSLIATGIAAVLAIAVVGVASAPAAAPAKTISRPVTARAMSQARILHLAVSATEASGNGAINRWSDDAWIGYPFGAGGFGSAGPAGFRQILDHSGIGVQTGVFGHRLYSRTMYVHLPGDALYDPSRNMIYELKPEYYAPPFLKEGQSAGCSDAGLGGFYAGMPATLVGATKQWDLRVQAGEIAGGMYLGGPSAKPFFSGQDSDIPDLGSLCVSEQVAALILHGSAKLVGTTRVSGRRAIEFRATNGSWTYYADALSNKPIRLVIRGIYGTVWPVTAPSKRERATLTLDVQTYEQLPFRGNEQLLNLTAQHPGVRIDNKPADYYAAQARLFPRRRRG